MRGRGAPASPLGLAGAIAVLLGASACQLLPALAPVGWSISLAAAALALSVALPALRLPLLLVFGFAYAMWRGEEARALRLDPALEGRPMEVVGAVRGFPVAEADVVRFEFAPERASVEGAPVPLDGKLRLAWYRSEWSPEPGQRLRVLAQMKRPHGAANPGGYDFERQALQSRIAATGYLRVAPERLDSGGAGLDHWRWRYSQAVRADSPDPAAAGLLAALAVGDQGAIPDDDWDALRATGTAHLVSISGFHIAVVAGLGALLARLAFRILPSIGLRLARPRLAAALALLAALSYAALAGWSVPVQRSLVMIGAIALAHLLRRGVTEAQSLGLALWAVLLLDPLAVLAPGFWLSFVGVAWLLWCLHGRREARTQATPATAPSGWLQRGVRAAGLAGLGRAQLAVGLGLLPLTIAFFQQGSLVGPLANAVAVPWVTLVVVPLALLCAACYAVVPVLLPWCLELALPAASWSLSLVGTLAGIPGSSWSVAEPGLATLLLALLGAAVLLLPRGIALRGLGALLFLPLLLPRDDAPPEGAFELNAIDVGQGLAMLVRTSTHALLYDAGPAPPNGLDMGEAAVIPALTAMGVGRLDRLVLSHADNDHAGGAKSVATRFRPDAIERSDAPGGPSCRAGERWEWDGVRFEYLHPPRDFPYLGNESSCVLKVQAGENAALLPGDVPELIEARLVREGSLGADVLVAPHHGSKGSSSAGFLAAVAPDAVLVSAGYRSRFGHPHPDALARYEAQGARVWNTADSGLLRVRVSAGGVDGPEAFRALRPRYWRERPAVTD